MKLRYFSQLSFCMVSFSMIASVFADSTDRFLQEAVEEDKTLRVISDKFGDLAERSAESGVFSPDEVGETVGKKDKVSNVRENNVEKIISAFSPSEESSDISKSLSSAGGEYKTAINVLESIVASNKKNESKMSLAESLEEQKRLAEDTKSLKEKSEKDSSSLDEEDIDKLAELAERQEKLAEKMEGSENKKMMESAAKDLMDADLQSAAKTQEDLVKKMEKSLNPETKPEDTSLVDNLSELAQIENSLMEAEKDIAESAKNPKDQSQKQNTAMKLASMAQKLDSIPETDNADEDINDAIEDLMTDQHDAATQKLRNAASKVKKAKKNLNSKLQEQIKMAEAMLEESKGEMQSNEAKRKLGTDSTDDWKSRLPEKERAALLSARKAKYNLVMEQSVKNYFTELAK